MDCIAQIPKKLFLIWLGDNLPKYASFAASAYQEMNPEFEIVVLHRTSLQLKMILEASNPQDYDLPLKRAMERVLSEEDSYITWQKNFYGTSASFFQLLSDVARVEVLNAYGGIYVDCDTFPVKTFDGNLLALDFFAVERRANGARILDNFFLGKKHDDVVVTNPYATSNASFVDCTLHANDKIAYYTLKKKFFDCTLKLGEHFGSSDHYIDHYNRRTWQDASLASCMPAWVNKIWKR